MKPCLAAFCAVQHYVVRPQRLRAQDTRHGIAQRPVTVLPDNKDDPSKLSSDPGHNVVGAHSMPDCVTSVNFQQLTFSAHAMRAGSPQSLLHLQRSHNERISGSLGHPQAPSSSSQYSYGTSRK